MRRFIRFDHLGNSLGEVSENDIMSLVRHEEINGEHSLTVTTFQVLSKNERVVYQDGRGVWREYVVAGVDEEHASGKRVIGTYYCVWSVQPDLMGVPVSVMPGVQNPVNAGTALTSALSTQSRWAKGTVTNTSEAGASMYDTNAWNALSILVENWSGELSTTIQVANNSGVTARKVDLYSQQGDQTAKRRFDFGDDLRSVKRTFADEPYYCRISPRGKGVESGGGYGRKITIESVNSGKDYLEYSPMVDFCKLPDGNSGYQYPTLIVENSQCETPTVLKTWAQSVLESYCTPKVTYEVDAIQAAAEGVDVQGVSLGDAVQIVDRYFGDGLRVSGRVVSMTVDELNEREISVTIGHVTEKLSAKISNTAQAVARMQEYMSTAEYIQDLLDRLNAEMNASGGYTYIVDGEGIWTYTCAVTDPTIGAEAKAIIQGGGSASVVNIKGGGIRIANSLTAQSEWNWRSVFTAGMIATDVLTATNITTGMIQDATHALNPNAGNYWDLDTGILSIKKGKINVSDSSNRTIFEADSTNRSVSIGNYTVDSNGLHGGLDGDDDVTHAGSFLGSYASGCDFLSSNGGNTRLKINNGWITGYHGLSVSSQILPSQGIGSTYGAAINADAIIFNGLSFTKSESIELDAEDLKLDFDHLYQYDIHSGWVEKYLPSFSLSGTTLTITT